MQAVPAGEVARNHIPVTNSSGTIWHFLTNSSLSDKLLDEVNLDTMTD